jgi:hypothetical protein
MFRRFPETSLKGWLMRVILNRIARQMTNRVAKTLCFISCFEQNTNMSIAGRPPLHKVNWAVCTDQMGTRQEKRWAGEAKTLRGKKIYCMISKEYIRGAQVGVPLPQIYTYIWLNQCEI